MKKFFKYALLVCLPALAIMGCAPAEDEKTALGALPDINSIEYSITPDAEDGTLMHFNILTPNVMGVWAFERPNITKTGVDITQGYAFKGIYYVTLSVYNKGGISQSKRIEFEVLESNPDLAAPFEFLTAKPWVWDNQNAGHIGNGDQFGTGPNWWIAPPNEQDPRVYDDTLIFHPNTDYQLITLGTVLCNEDAAEAFGVTPKPAGSVLIDYGPPPGQTWNLFVEKNGDQSTTFLSFGGGGFPSYIPNGAYATNKYAIIQLDENILSIRVDLGWGAFYMRFTHPN